MNLINVVDEVSQNIGGLVYVPLDLKADAFNGRDAVCLLPRPNNNQERDRKGSGCMRPDIEKWVIEVQGLLTKKRVFEFVCEIASHFRLPREGEDHVHCTVEPSPGHTWCRL